jgi:hypothetical protein
MSSEALIGVLKWTIGFLAALGVVFSVWVAIWLVVSFLGWLFS